MLDVREAVNAHEAVDLDGGWVADTVDIVAGEVDQHDVLGTVLSRGQQLSSKSIVLLRVQATLDGTSDGVVDDLGARAGLGSAVAETGILGKVGIAVRLHQAFGRGADNVEVGAREEEEVW